MSGTKSFIILNRNDVCNPWYENKTDHGGRKFTGSFTQTAKKWMANVYGVRINDAATTSQNTQGYVGRTLDEVKVKRSARQLSAKALSTWMCLKWCLTWSTEVKHERVEPHSYSTQIYQLRQRGSLSRPNDCALNPFNIVMSNITCP